MAKKMIFVPCSWNVTFDTIDGIEKTVTVSPNEDYRVTVDGNVRYLTFKGVTETPAENPHTVMNAQYELVPGYMSVIREINEDIDIDRITDIQRVHTKYTSVQRSAKDFIKEEDEDSSFTFLFDTKNYSSKYRITILADEFVSMVVRDASRPTGTKTLFGHIVDVDDDDNIVFCRFISNKCVRDLRPHYVVKIEDLLGIYRYELEVEDYKEIEKVEAVDVKEDVKEDEVTYASPDTVVSE